MIRYDKAKIWKVLFWVEAPWETEIHDVYILKGLVQNGENITIFLLRDIYILIHSWLLLLLLLLLLLFCFPPVVFGKKFARRIGRKRVDRGAAGRNRMVGPIGSASALAGETPASKKKSARKSSWLHPGRLTWNLKMIVWKMIFRWCFLCRWFFNDSLENDSSFLSVGDF